MNSLFLKIFLWFWGAMALTVVAFATVVANTQPPSEQDALGISTGERPRRRGQRRGPDTRGGPVQMVRVAAELLQAGGKTAALDYFERLEKTEPAYGGFFDQSGVPLSSHQNAAKNPLLNAQRAEVERQLSELTRRAAQTGSVESTPRAAILYAAQLAESPNGERLVLGIAWRNQDRPPPPRGGPGRVLDWLLFAPLQIQLMRLLAALMTTGLVCFLLARHLTSPLFYLRQATQKLASGDLSTRVEKLGERSDEMGLLGRDFNRMAAQLESLVNGQNRLVADISHELRSPLARLSVALGLARETAGQEAKEDLDRIERESEQLNALIGQLLTLWRLESGEQKAGNDEINLARLVEEIAADAEFEARGRGVSVQIEELAPAELTGNESLLRSAIENVIRNATRYTKPEIPVAISLQREKDAAILRVCDGGPGVPEESLEQLFRPFYRVEGARDRQSGGAGLGLAITASAIQLHGGSVRATNGEKGGLCVEMRLPLES